jgi:hypothetical protein
MNPLLILEEEVASEEFAFSLLHTSQ